MTVDFELIDRCRCCRSDRLEEVLDLGDQPPANSLRLPDEPRPGEVPLVLARCSSCATVQLTATVNPATLFSNYVWVTGTASTTRIFSEVFCREVLSHMETSGRGRPDGPGLVIEVASNDGTFLRRFKERGWRVLGIDPARNIVERAVAAGIPTRCEFFGTETAASISREFGPADIVIARNVVPHVAEIHEVLEGVVQLLHRGGLVAIEFHHAGSILTGLQYDSIYHEHLFYFSPETLGALCASHGLHVFEVFESPLSGGALVMVFAKEQRTPSSRLKECVRSESESKVDLLETWEAFGKAVRVHSESLSQMVAERAKRGTVVGYGASARSATLLNTAGISGEEVQAVIDRNELKHGRLTPGSDIPIVPFEEGLPLLQTAESLLLLAWNFESEIVTDVRDDGFEGEILLPLPGELRLI